MNINKILGKIKLPIIILGCIGAFWFLLLLSNTQEQPEQLAIPHVTPKDIQIGKKNAKVTLIEYADFQCPSCAQYYPLVKKLSTDFPKDLLIVYRFFPLITIHKNSMIAAQYAYGAYLQNQFWNMHDILFEKQREWADKENPSEEFISYANALHLNIKKLTKTVMDKETQNYINDQEEKGVKAGIDSTPTFFINGNKINNPTSYEEFKKTIETELSKNK